ncbi:MAG: acyltransferase [Halioglobus sp.]
MKIDALTPLRFIAAAVVVIFHFGLKGSDYVGFFSAGPQMVSFFFVLSGFVMAFAHYEKPLDLKLYYIARAARILPLYFLALICLWLVYITIDVTPNPVGVVLNFTLLQAWYPPLALSMNSPGWSLSIEAFFYIIFPFLLVLLTRSNWRTPALFVMALVLWLGTQMLLSSVMSAGFYSGPESLARKFVHYFPLSHLCSFVLGVVGGIWFRRASPRINSAWLSTAFIILAAGVLVFALENQGLIRRTVGFKLAFRSSFLSPLYLFVILAVAVSRGPLISLLSLRPLVFLGEISYGVYILQFPVYVVFRFYIGEHLGLSEPAYFMVYFVLLLLVSALCYVFFEKPANTYCRFVLPRQLKMIGDRNIRGTL